MRGLIRDERGLTLAELMVAVVFLGIIIIVGFDFYTSQSSYLERTRIDSEMQQELRWGMDFITNEVRLAGNGVPTTSGWQVLKNTNGPSGSPDTLCVMGAFTSSVIHLEQPMGSKGSQVKVTNSIGLGIGDLVTISDGTFREIFLVTDINELHLWHNASPPWNPTNQLEHKYKKDSTVTTIFYHQFYIATDAEGRKNLMLKSVSQNPEVLIGDAEDFQVRFHLKNGTWAEESTDVYNINLVEVTIKVRSPRELRGYTDPVFGDAYKRMDLKKNVVPKNLAIM